VREIGYEIPLETALPIYIYIGRAVSKGISGPIPRNFGGNVEKEEIFVHICMLLCNWPTEGK
jgi:hypothetical protein